MLKRLALTVAVAASLTIGTAQAQDSSGTVYFRGAGGNCFKIGIVETGINYAIDYTNVVADPSPQVIAFRQMQALGWMTILTDSFGGPITIKTDGTKLPSTICGDGSYYRISAVNPE